MEQFKGLAFFKKLALEHDYYALDILIHWHLHSKEVGIKIPLDMDKFKLLLAELASKDNVMAENTLTLFQ